MANIKENKATGPDGIPGKILKMCANELADVYRLLFQASLDQGALPDDWKDACIVPLFKKGDRSKAENYRPVSLTSISSKLLEHIVHSNIMDHLDKFGFLNDAQHGFRQKRSCETQLITTLNDFSDCLNNKEQIDAILLDFSKAFDKVDHEGLLLKLEHAGINGNLLLWIRSFLIGINQKVMVEGAVSESRPVISGVPQGTVLGPLLFLIYINDIDNKISSGTKIRLFADDSLLYRTIKTDEDSAILQNDLNQLQEWEKTWKMEFHPHKCQLIRITNKVKPISNNYAIHNITLQETASAKYLGIFIDNKLKWKEQYNYIIKKANNIIAFLQRNINSCPASVKSQCFQTLVRPVLEYGCAVWDPHHQIDIERIEKVQKRAARFATGNYVREEGNTKINMEILQWKPLEERRAIIKLNLLFKANHNEIHLPTNPLIRNMSRTRRGHTNYAIPSSSVDSHLYSFYPNVIRLWNSLPTSCKSQNSTDAFKQCLDKITIRSAHF